MSDFLVTYDLKRDHTKVKNALKQDGWRETKSGVAGNGSTITCKLPNTSLWRESLSTVDALREQVRSIITANSSSDNLERIIVVKFDSWASILGSDYQ